MGELMYYYVQSQILNFQVGINEYKIAQNKKIWRKEILPSFNKNLTVGILGLGFLGTIVAKSLKEIITKSLVTKKLNQKNTI